MSGSKSQASNQSQSTSQQSLDPQIKGALLGNYADTSNLVANTPTAYTGPLVAGFNPTQTAAFSGINGIANSDLGNSALGGAQTALTGAAGYTPQSVTTQNLPQVDLSGYMDPYTQDVTNTTLSDLQRQNQQANVANDASATSAGAFGGDRSAVLDAQTNEAYARTGASTLAGLNQANFGQAQTAAQADLARQAAVAQANQGAGLQGQQLNLQAGSGLAALSGQQVSQALAKQGAALSVGNQQQANTQAGYTASQGNFQQTLQNILALYGLKNQSLGLAGNPTLNSSQSTGSGSSSSFGFTLPTPASLAGG